ncbi:hypothetical protein [Glutamicibacter sp. MCAF14]|uniref:hypothetical protein n=1 Tax=Glutamicibacter sp. MCAF14 TaxID=3233043 RepID=UPI003F90AD4D
MYNAPCILKLKAPSVHERSIFNQYRILNSSGRLGASRPIVFAVHGVGVVDGKWVSNIGEAQRVIDETELNYESLGASIKGSITVYIVDVPSQKIILLCDPFGSSIVYVYESDACKAVSSDLASLRDGLSTVGIHLEKDLTYAALYVATNTGGLAQSSYMNVRSIEPFRYLSLDVDEFHEVEYKSLDNLSFPSYSYDELLDKAANDVIQNIEAASTHNSRAKISQLTGGADSRLVLGALLASGKETEFNFYCSGNINEPDKIISRQLSNQFDLSMTDYSGLNPMGQPDTFEDFISQPFDTTAGILSGPAHPMLEYGDELVFSGGYGEFLRSAFDKGQRYDGDVATAMKRIYGNTSFSEFPSRRLISEPAYEFAINRFSNLISFGITRGVPEDSRLDAAYIVGRNRYFVGETTRSLSPFVARFDPLYSPYVLALGLKASLEEKASAFPLFDLMNRFEPTLMKLPFDSPRIKPYYEEVRGPVSRVDFTYDPSIEPRMVIYKHNHKSRKTMKSYFQKPSSNDIAIANDLHTAPRLVAQNAEVQKRLKVLVSDTGMESISKYFNPLIVNLIINRKPTHRVHLRQSSNLYAALLWYLRS